MAGRSAGQTAEAVGVGLGGLDNLLKVRAGLAAVLMRGGRVDFAGA
jgi:hypothetical protein